MKVMTEPLDLWPEIHALHKQGFSTRYIVGELDLDLGPRQLRDFIDRQLALVPALRGEQREVSERVAWVPRNLGEPGRQPYDHFRPGFVLLLRQLFESEGRDIHRCESCGVKTESPCVIHHTKYQGATYYDLMLVCSRCNNLPENQHLA